MKAYFIGLWRVKFFWLGLKVFWILKNPLQYFRRNSKEFLVASNSSPSLESYLRMIEKMGYSFETDSVLDNELKSEVIKYCENLKSECGEFLPIDHGVGKSYLRSLVKEHNLHSDSPLIKFATQSFILKLATKYIGEVPYLHYVDVFETSTANLDGWREAQLWHRDYPNTKMLKVFIYLNDVFNQSDGPFGILSNKKPNLYKEPFFRSSLHPFRVDDEVINQQHKGDITLLYGPKGTIFFTDTGRNLHFGSRLSENKSRLVYVATFSNYYTFPFSRNRVQIKGAVTDQERLVLSK